MEKGGKRGPRDTTTGGKTDKNDTLQKEGDFENKNEKNGRRRDTSKEEETDALAKRGRRQRAEKTWETSMNIR